MTENYNAIVVEDDEHISYLLGFLLEKSGYNVKIANDGKKAKTLFEVESPPRVVVLDIMLPFHDGYELLQMIRANSQWKRVPVLMLTAKSQEEDIVKAMELGANDFLVKPFQPMDLLARLKRIAIDQLEGRQYNIG